MKPSPERVALSSMAANLALAGAKVFAGITGRSFALTADGIESTTDILSSLIVWRGLRIGGIAPDEDHPYGHGKAEALAGFVASGLLMISALFIGWQAIDGILEPGESPALFTVPLLIGIVAIKEGLFRWVRSSARSSRSQALKVEAWHHRSDALTSLGTLAGITLAVFGGPRWAVADDIAALLLSGLIAWNGYRLMRPTIDELMDRQVEGERLERIHGVAAEMDGIVRLETVHLRRSGRYFVADIHLEVDGGLSVHEGHSLAHRLRDQLEADEMLGLIHISTHVEPSFGADTKKTPTAKA